uniref:Caspase-4-1b n=1 Tax=Manduca sexta TaxID=7130 RepID=F6K5S0_MANSE|nr:caspase-4-1b [Manduca sexta]
MDSELQDTSLQKTETELKKKRKRRNRGKQTRMSDDVDNGSSDSNVVEADALDNANTEEIIDLMTNKWEIDDSPRVNNDINENTEYYETSIDTIHSQNPSRVETGQRFFSDANNDDEYYRRKDANLTADNNVNIFTGVSQKTNNVFTTYDGIASSCVTSNENITKMEKSSITRLTSEDVEKLYPSTSSATETVPQLYNARALPKEAKTYELENFDRNVLIIFNQKDFGTHQRLGTDQDVKALKKTFEAFNFDVLPYTDRTVAQIKEILDAISCQDFSDYGCVAIAVLTHGDIDGSLSAKDDDYPEMDIINTLKTHKNHSLITKPRLLFVQACRGPNALAGVPVLRKGKVKSNLFYDSKPYTLPVEADMLVVHSSYTGNRTHRHEVDGSWFIQTLCKKINEMGQTDDLETILTHIKHEVAIDKEHEVYNRVTGEYDINKQMPVVTTTLIRKLYLRRDAAEGTVTSNTSEMPGAIAVDSHNAGANPEPCLCTLDYYNYIRDCLREYVRDHDQDTTARSLLDLTKTFKDEETFNATKEQCALTIADHLEHSVKHYERYKFVYIKRI